MTIRELVSSFLYEAGNSSNPIDIFLIIFSVIAVILVLCGFIFSPLSLISFTLIRGLIVLIGIWSIRIYFFINK